MGTVYANKYDVEYGRSKYQLNLSRLSLSFDPIPQRTLSCRCSGFSYLLTYSITDKTIRLYTNRLYPPWETAGRTVTLYHSQEPLNGYHPTRSGNHSV